MARTVAIILLLIGTAYADDSCVAWDDNVEDMLIAPARDLIPTSFERIPDLDENFGWGTHVKILGALVGNLKSFDTVKLPGRESSSYMCQNNTNITIALDMTVKDLNLTFDNFQAKIPVLPDIGDTRATFINTGNKWSVSVTLMTDDQSNCIASLNYLQLHDFGTTTFNFENGRINKIYQWILSHGFGPVTSILKRFNLLKSVDQALQQVASTLIAQQGQKICNILNGGL